MDGLVAIVIGLVLCFAGARSVHLAVLLAGFGAGWMLSRAFDAGTGTALIIGLAAAVLAWVLVSLVFRSALFVVGGILGCAIGARVYSVLEGESSSAIVAIVFVLAVGFLCGWMANRWRVRALIWLTAIGGAALALHGVGIAFPDSLGALSRPDGAGQSTLNVVAWAVLAGLGWWSQRNVATPRQLDRR